MQLIAFSLVTRSIADSPIRPVLAPTDNSTYPDVILSQPIAHHIRGSAWRIGRNTGPVRQASASLSTLLLANSSPYALYKRVIPGILLLSGLPVSPSRTDSMLVCQPYPADSFHLQPGAVFR